MRIKWTACEEHAGHELSPSRATDVLANDFSNGTKHTNIVDWLLDA
jgi:hypothetical protein